MSSMRSASSSTEICTLLRSTSRRSMKSQSRPGVAMITSAPCRSACNWVDSLRPPTTTAERNFVPAATWINASLIWIASSRVGLSTTARTPVPFSPERFQHRKHESECLARTRRRGCHDIAARQSGRYRLRLHGAGLRKPCFRRFV